MMRHPGIGLKERIIPSSSVIFWRSCHTENGVEIFLAKRKKNLKAFPNLWSGIGGKIDSSDREYVQKHFIDSSFHEEFFFKACAIREVFEETNILLAKTKIQDSSKNEPITLESLNLPFDEFKWDTLIPAGIKDTPKFTNISFHTQFFLVEYNSKHELKIDASNPEFSEGQWKSPKEWLLAFEQQQLQIPPPVLEVIRMINQHTIPNAARALESKNNFPVGLQTKVEVHPGIQVIPLLSHTVKPAITTNFIIVGRDQYFLVDPGTSFPNEINRLNEILNNGISSIEAIEAILLTHHHEDHWSSVPYLQEQYNIPVYCHQGTKNHLPDEIFVTKVLSDGDLIELGYDCYTKNKWNLKVIYTGGHSHGHILFLDSRFNALLAGDFVAGIGTVLVGDMGQYITGLRRLLDLHVGVIVPGHGPVHYNGQSLLENYLDHRLERQRLILESFDSETTKTSLTVMDIVNYAYKDVPQEYYQLAARQVKTYLVYLVEKNLIQQKNELYTRVTN
ncbi:MAG: MBL fold metallo-hydrolase [Candidatus Hodarchaeales archaeon]|jgi:glyoxylase-like metal-dependent hydrolase (beta-lactamase superfamily II)/8-oxo-dGTP pyrophosphatase MutT (NUDIX family)